MSTITENIINTRYFKKAVSEARKFSAQDLGLLRAYYLSAKNESSFLFQWLDRLEKGGLTREQVLSVIHGADDNAAKKTPASPRKYQRKPRATTPTPEVSPATSPRRPPKRKQQEEQPKTPTVATVTRSAFTPPPKKIRSSKHEIQVDDEPEDDDSSSSDDDDEDHDRDHEDEEDQ